MEKKVINNIGTIEGKVLVFGGIYSNFQALTALKNYCDLHQIAPDNIICTGDVVAYCAEPESCVQLIKEWGIWCILGNVEQQIRDGQMDCACDFAVGSRCDMYSRDWYPYAVRQVSSSSIDWMHTLPQHIRFRYADKECMVVHGSFDHISEFIFKSSSWSQKQNVFDQHKIDLVLAGHSGLPFADINKDHYWLNAGVIGMPANDGTPDGWFLCLDDSGGFDFAFHRLPYDYEKASQAMLREGLPKSYAATLRTGIWDNCEILPSAETLQQGVKIDLDFDSKG